MAVLLELVMVCLVALACALLNSSFPQWLRPRWPLAGYAEWKWRNIIVSLLHSTISGLSALYLTLDYAISDTPSSALSAIGASLWPRLLLCFSIGYFLYDTLLSWSKLGHYPGRVEIIVHHVITTATLALTLFEVPLLSQFMPYCAFGLVIELNNVFIHLRSLMELSHFVTSRRALLVYKVNSASALGSVILFRFIPLYWILVDVSQEVRDMPLSLLMPLLLPIVAIILISVVIFWRILADDFLRSPPQSEHHHHQQ